MQCAQTLRRAAGRVVDSRVGPNLAADNFHHVDAAGKWIGDGAETISREGLAARILSRSRLAFLVFAMLLFMMRRVRRELDNMIEQSRQTDQRRGRYRVDRAELARGNRLANVGDYV